MTNNSRSAQRVPSRTPPFVLVGLLVVMSFLGYSYYSLSSSNSSLSSELEAVRLEKRDTDSKRFDLEKTLSSLKAQVVSLQTEANQLKRDRQAEDMEIQSLKADLKQKVADNEKQKSLLERCDEKLSVVQKDLESANYEKSNLQGTLDAEREKTAICSMEACQGPIHQVLIVSSKLVGSTKMKEALSQAQLDGVKLMDGIDFPAPEIVMPQVKPHPDTEFGKPQEVNKQDMPHQAEGIKVPPKESQILLEQSNDAQNGQVDKFKESVAQVTMQHSGDEIQKKVTSAAKAALTEAPVVQFNEVEHQGDDGNRSFPNDSNGDKQINNDRVNHEKDEEEAEDLDQYDGQEGRNMHRALSPKEEQPNSLDEKDKASVALDDKFNQIKPNEGEPIILSELNKNSALSLLGPNDGNSFKQLKPNEGNTWSLGMNKVAGEMSKKPQEMKETEEPVAYRAFLEKRNSLNDQRNAEFGNGDDIIQRFEAFDKKDSETN